MNLNVDPAFHMWFVLGLMLWAIYSFIREKWSIEVTSVALLTALLIFGQFFPLQDVNGHNQLDAMRLLAGFANPSLVAVLALLVMGQAMIHTDALRAVTGVFRSSNSHFAWFSILGLLIFVAVASAFLNNTPLVIIVIPIIQVLAASAGLSESRLMIPLSYVAILGGMTTLIGSSTNLLVSSSMVELGYEPLEFFDFVIPGMILAAIGMVYAIFIVPYLLKDRASMAKDLAGDDKEFVAELDITDDSKLIGLECVEGKFEELQDLRIKMIQRSGYLILPPFEGYKIESGDIMIVSATRNTLMALLSKYPGFLLSEEEEKVLSAKPAPKQTLSTSKAEEASKPLEVISEAEDEIDEQEGEAEAEELDGKAKDAPDEAEEQADAQDAMVAESRLLAEIMITPASRLVDMSLEHSGIERQYGVVILGIQRRARVVRRRLGRIRLEAGDVLLIAGQASAIDSMRHNSDFIVLSGSKKELPSPAKAPIAGVIFLSVIGLAALGIVSIPVAAIAGAVLMIATGCLNIRQATRAVDRKIFLLVGSMLALGVALQASGGARYIADLLTEIPHADNPLVMVSLLFLVVAACTNVLSNNACAILFTPIAMNLAGNVNVPEGFEYDIAFVFAITVIFAANCSFASPIGYQTNLLVMGPGHYRFRDFVKAGVPLMFIIWLGFIGVAHFYFGL